MKVAILHAVLPRVIKSRILEAGVTRSLNQRLVPKICEHVAAVVAGDPQARQKLETLLEQHKLTVDLILAAAFDDRIVSQLQDHLRSAAGLARLPESLKKVKINVSDQILRLPDIPCRRA